MLYKWVIFRQSTYEASLNGRRPEHEGADAVDGKSQDESIAVSKSSNKPTRVGQRANEVGAKVGSLQTGRLPLGNVEGDLESGVEYI
jgi:hypothetical protein